MASIYKKGCVYHNVCILSSRVQNAAIFWYNYKRSGSMDPLSLHAACPVVIGEKWGKFDWR